MAVGGQPSLGASVPRMCLLLGFAGPDLTWWLWSEAGFDLLTALLSEEAAEITW